MANTRGLLARLTWFCFWPIEGQWRASVSMPRHNVSQKQHGWKERPPQRLSISGGTACIYAHIGIATDYTHIHTLHDAWARVRTDDFARDTGGDRTCAYGYVGMAKHTQVTKSKPNCTLATPLHYTTLMPHSHKHTTSALLQHNEVWHTETFLAPSGQWQAQKNTQVRSHTRTHTNALSLSSTISDIHTSLSHKRGGGGGVAG